MEIIITKKQLQTIVEMNEDFGIPDEYEGNDKVNVKISSPYGELKLGEIRENLLKKLQNIVSNINMMDDANIFVDFE